MSAMLSPREQDWLVGHAAAQAALIAATKARRLHHAWLISGPQGVGKATLAFRFARWILAGAPGDTLAIPEQHPVFRRVAAGTHADLLAIGRSYDEKRQRFRGEIVADDVRPIGEFLRRTAAEGGWRVVVLDDADLMNRHAANALLKILEEPPPQAVLILVSSAPGRLLPTIRSRCRALRLEALPPTELAIALARLLPEHDEAARAVLAASAHGTPGQALALAAEDGIAMGRLVNGLLDEPDAAKRGAYALAERILKNEQGFSTFHTLLADAISGRVRDAARSGQPSLAPGRDWLSIWQELRRMRDETERFNLDKRQALLSSLSLLSEP